MTNEEAKKMLKAKLECLKNETSGINHDCNMRLCDGCSLNYEQGNMGEQKEALDMAIQALEQQPCEDCISRTAAVRHRHLIYDDDGIGYSVVRVDEILSLPSVTPKFTDEEIQKMQELEQAQLEKAYELGMQTSFEEWLASFNTESATECFTAVQELKKKIMEEE